MGTKKVMRLLDARTGLMECKSMWSSSLGELQRRRELLPRILAMPESL